MEDLITIIMDISSGVMPEVRAIPTTADIAPSIGIDFRPNDITL